MTGRYRPRGEAAPVAAMVAAQAGMELRLLLRNGEQLLLTIVIPTLLLVLFATVPLVAIPTPRVGFLVPGVLALAVMSTAFTGQAIAVGFERRYLVLKRLGATPLPRWGLLTAKTLAVCAVEVLQIALLVGIGFALGWSPHGSAGPVIALLLLGTVAFSALGLLMAGVLRAEATLAAANLGYLGFLALGGVVFAGSSFPAGLRHVVGWLPVTALASGLRAVLRSGSAVPGHAWLVLVLWAAAALTGAALTFRWE